MQTFFFYQNMICPHESSFLRALSSRPNVRITWVVDTETLPYRRKMGIDRPDCGQTEVIVTTDVRTVQRIVAESGPEVIHIVQGPRGGVCSAAAWRMGLSGGRRMGLFFEPGDHRGLKGLLRRALYIAESLCWGRYMQFLLATGQLGEDWYLHCGYPRRKVYPFCYVTESPDLDANRTAVPNTRFHVAYCGQLVARKNVDLLLQALAQVADLDWYCTIIGDGPLKTRLMQRASSLRIADRILWLGVIPYNAMPQALVAADVLVLPSRFDGWGAVVNETLSVGTPVICTKACGAADLLRDPWRGETVASESSTQMAEALRRQIKLGTVSLERRQLISTWTREHVGGEAVAEYFLALMTHVYGCEPRPLAPWRQISVLGGGSNFFDNA